MAKGFPNVGATVIDTSADLPAASAALEGVMMFQKDSNELKICDGSSWVSVIDTDSPNGMVLLKTTTLSSATSFSPGTIFSSAFVNYKIMLNITAYSNVGQTQTNMYVANNTTPHTSTYYWERSYFGSANVSGSSAGANTGLWQISDSNNSSAGIQTRSSIELYNPFILDKTFMFCNTTTRDIGVSSYGISSAGLHDTAASYDSITISPNAGTFTGTAWVYGYRNSI